MNKAITFLIFTLSSIVATAQEEVVSVNSRMDDSLTIRQIFDDALLNGESYTNLNYLCKAIGHRITGSPQSLEAVDWAEEELLQLGVNTVGLQSIQAPKWVRGDKEWVAISEDVDLLLNACALGGSIGTNGPLQADVVEVNGIEELKAMDPSQINGKIVFFNKPMDKRKINTFDAYGGCVAQRYWGAVEAAQFGAKAVLVRSLTTLTDIHPHTGSMAYDPKTTKIPAAAISTQDAEILHQYIQDLGTAKVTMNLNCYSTEPILTHNVYGEIKGKLDPNKVIVVGAHLDSWDKGEGAHDDGAGVVQCMEVLRIFKALKIQPNYTIRVVLYMNEENGNMGGKTYAERAFVSGVNHIVALETDRGGFSPRGFFIDGDSSQIARIATFRPMLEEYGLHLFERGYGGVDIGPLKDQKFLVNPSLILLGLYTDSQRYFDYHHSELDVFETVNQRELELGGASLAAMVYLMDKHWEAIR